VKLPYQENAVIPQRKITEYLLSSTHRDGRHKAAFFMQFGFSAERWEEMASAFRRHAAENEVVKQEDSPFGDRYVIEGPLITPDGRMPLVRVVLVHFNRENHSDSCHGLSALKNMEEPSMVQELDSVVLTTDLPEYGLESGDIGTVVLVHQDGAGYEVEFMTLDGKTMAIVTLRASQTRQIASGEIAHARMVTTESRRLSPNSEA
jgi:hypothetical protein